MTGGFASNLFLLGVTLLGAAQPSGIWAFVLLGGLWVFLGIYGFFLAKWLFGDGKGKAREDYRGL